MKNKEKKIRMSEVVLIIILLLILAIFLLVAWRYYTLINIQKNNNLYLSGTNYYYYSENKNIIMEFWKKDNINKLNIKQLNSESDITFWKDVKTGEEYTFYNNTKEFSKNQGGIQATKPSSMIIVSDNFDKFLLAINPTIYIATKEYNDTKCYYVKVNNQEELIEKETGLLLKTKNEEDERDLKYSFNTVTDEDVEKPDISQYTLQEEKVLQ